MTLNESITVVSNILEKYHGCRFGEVFDRKSKFKNEPINKNALYISREDYTYFYLSGFIMFRHDVHELCVYTNKLTKFKNCEDVYNFFKIELKDIV